MPYPKSTNLTRPDWFRMIFEALRSRYMTNSEWRYFKIRRSYVKMNFEYRGREIMILPTRLCTLWELLETGIGLWKVAYGEEHRTRSEEASKVRWGLGKWCSYIFWILYIGWESLPFVTGGMVQLCQQLPLPIGILDGPLSHELLFVKALNKKVKLSKCEVTFMIYHRSSWTTLQISTPPPWVVVILS